MSDTIHINCQFDSGNIQVLDASNAEDIRLAIRKDHQSEFYQWFHFKVHARANTSYRYVIENAQGSAYVDGWQNYQAVASYDRETWFRVETSYDEGCLQFTHLHEHEVVYYAYFAPYSYERHMDLLAYCQESSLCQLEHLGMTLDGRDMTLAIIGDETDNKQRVWVTARQHPGETMAEWFMEGFIQRLLDEDDPLARRLLERCVFYVVPNMNPDGCYRGHLRTNAAGANLNREWQEPSMTRSPEVFLVRQKMCAIGVDLFLDIHGDEAIPYNFLAGAEGVPSYDTAMAERDEKFRTDFMKASPDFQDQHGYAKNAPGSANLSMATAWVGEQFQCLAFTLEMPFKDNDDLPDELYGWSPERCIKLGEAICHPLWEAVRN